MTTVAELSAPIIAEFGEWVNGLLSAASASPEGSLDELLARVRQEGRRLLGRVAEAAGACQERYQAAPECAGCGVRMRSKGFRERYVVSLLGELRLPLRRWRCPRCGTERQPSAEALGLRCQLAREVQEVTERLATAMPFRQAETMLARFGCQVSDNTVAEVARQRGGELAAARRAEAEQVAALAFEPPAERRPERLYEVVDGCYARVRESPTGWTEVRTAVLYETAAQGPDAEGHPPPARWVRLLASAERCDDDEAQADSFFALLYPLSLRCGARYAQEIVLLADGAEWLWRRLPQVVPLGVRSVEILDCYHALENAAQAARAVAGEEGYEARFARWRQWILAGLCQQVIDELQAALPDQNPPQEAVNALEYLRRHRHRMRYLRWRLDGYQIGSGAVESSCKRLLQRVRGSGMRWSRKGLEAMLALHSQHEEEAWNDRRRAA